MSMPGLSQAETMILQSLSALERQVAELSGQLEEIKGVSQAASVKDWYSTTDVAELMNVSQYTVQERWCNAGRIECEKEPESGKWRIPGSEYERLRRGGKPRRTSRS